MSSPANTINKRPNHIYLCDEISFRSQQLRGKLHRVNNQRILAGGLLRPRTADIRRAIMQHQVECWATVFRHDPPNSGPALGISDILLQRDGAAYGSNRIEIDADYEASDGHPLDADLHPSSWSGAEVEHGASRAEEAEFGVELHELPSSSRSVAVLLGEVIELVQTMLSLHFPHL